jgi:hypothetical protein
VTSRPVLHIHRLERVPRALMPLLMLWELLQTVLGLVVFAAMVAGGRARNRATLGGRLVVRTASVGVSLGFLVFWFPASEEGCVPLAEDPILRHELGHAVQSAWLGPLYLLAVGVPSFARAVYATMYAARHRRPWAGYYRGYPENWANRLGGVVESSPT